MRICRNLYQPSKEGFAIYKLLTKTEDKFVCFRKYSTGDKISRVFYTVDECVKWLDSCPPDYSEFINEYKIQIVALQSN